MLTIKPKIKEIQGKRIRNGLGTKQLASKAKLSHVTILNIENLTSVPNPSTASKICKALEASFDELFELVDNEKEGE